MNVKCLWKGKLNGKDENTWNDTHDDFMTRLLYKIYCLVLFAAIASAEPC
jgi:hypothetical protein